MPTFTINVRRQVAQFALLMESKLRLHDRTRGRRGWKDDFPGDFIHRVRQEGDELRDAVQNYIAGLIDCKPGTFTLARRRHNVGKEAADVGNFCMMIADTSGALPGITAGEKFRQSAIRKDAALIAATIEAIDDRAMASDGPVTPTLKEATQEELTRIYRAAKRIAK